MNDSSLGSLPSSCYTQSFRTQKFEPDCDFRFQLRDLKDQQDIDFNCPIQEAGSNASKALGVGLAISSFFFANVLADAIRHKVSELFAHSGNLIKKVAPLEIPEL